MRSAKRRVLTKTRVVRCSRTSCARRSYTVVQASPDITASSGVGGNSSARSRLRAWPLSMRVQSPARRSAPTRNRATSSMGVWVADNPTRTSRRRGQRLQALERQRKVGTALVGRHRVNLIDDDGTARGQHRRGPIPSPTERITTRAWSPRYAAACGACGRAPTAGVSPVRTIVRMSTSGRRVPRARRECRRGAPPELRWMSFDNAFKGDM